MRQRGELGQVVLRLGQGDGGEEGSGWATGVGVGGNVGVGFAVPANIARRVIDQLIEHGRTKSGWIGVTIQDVDKPMAETFGWKKAKGAIVSRVNKDGPADKAGIKPGDVMVVRYEGPKGGPGMREMF